MKTASWLREKSRELNNLLDMKYRTCDVCRLQGLDVQGEVAAEEITVCQEHEHYAKIEN